MRRQVWHDGVDSLQGTGNMLTDYSNADLESAHYEFIDVSGDHPMMDFWPLCRAFTERSTSRG
jgi:hypothetical protein